jgi:pimeloyl-ACP methyl ester carboxylesterase
MAEDAKALMDAAGWNSAHVIGHSMGGVIAQQLALDCPKRVRSLSLLCTFARGKDAARLRHGFSGWLSARAYDHIALPHYGQALAGAIPGARFD